MLYMSMKFAAPWRWPNSVAKIWRSSK